MAATDPCISNRDYGIIRMEISSRLLKGFRYGLDPVNDLHRTKQFQIDSVGVADQTQDGRIIAGICMDLKTHVFQPICQETDLFSGSAVLQYCDHTVLS
jgi:hypothetical protein